MHIGVFLDRWNDWVYKNTTSRDTQEFKLIDQSLHDSTYRYVHNANFTDCSILGSAQTQEQEVKHRPPPPEALRCFGGSSLCNFYNLIKCDTVFLELRYLLVFLRIEKYKERLGFLYEQHAPLQIS